jgi:hypothetical protein
MGETLDDRLRGFTPVRHDARVLDAIEAAVDAATHAGRGQVLLVHGRLDDALENFASHRGELLAGSFDVPGMRGDWVSADGVRRDDPHALAADLEALLGGARTVVLGLADLDRAFPPVRWHDVFLRHTLPALVAAHRLVVVASVTVDGVLGDLDATLIPTGAAEPDPAAADAPLEAAFAHHDAETAAKGVDLARRTLRVAALEGEVFTVAAVARVLDEDEDALTDWLDDHLATDEGPLEDIGFVAGRERQLDRYRFRDRAVWAALTADPPGRRLPRRYAEVLAELYGPAAPEAAFRIWTLSGAEDPDDYRALANGAAHEHDHVRLLEVERDPQRFMESLRQVVFSLPSEDLLRYAHRLVELSAVGTEALYDLLGVVAGREQWLGDAARCHALALELLDEPFPVVQRCIFLAGALLDLAHWQTGGEPRLGLEVAWLDAIVDDREALIAAAAERLERAGEELERVDPADREHWRAHLQHAVAQLDAVRGDADAARRGEERVLELLTEAPGDSCNLGVLALFALADAREALEDFEGARDAARQGVQLAVSRSELAEAARGLSKVGRTELALGDAQAAAQALSFSLVIVLELGLRWAEPGLWMQMAQCFEEPGAAYCLAMAGATSADVSSEAVAHAASVRGESGELRFIEELTGITREATEQFLGSLVGGEE